MKIGIICYPTYGGSGVVATELGKQLAREGNEVHFISFNIPFRLNSFEENIFFHKVKWKDYPLFDNPPYTIAFATKLAEVIEDVGLQIIHAHYALPFAFCEWAAQEISSTDIKTVLTLHGSDVSLVGNDVSFKRAMKHAIEKVDAVTTVSNYLKERAIDEFELSVPIQRIYNFVDTEKFSPDCCEEETRKAFKCGDEKVLIHVSNFRPVKRVLDVLRVFKKLYEKLDCKLILVGDGPDRNKAFDFARENNILDKVCFTGKLDKVRELYCISDLLILPSEEESFGLVTAEAMSSSTPVIASDVGGLPEVIEHGEVGFLAPVGDTDKMSQYAERILADDERLQGFKQRAREHVRNKFSKAKIIKKYTQLYQAL